jgi:hypothetical protein
MKESIRQKLARNILADTHMTEFIDMIEETICKDALATLPQPIKNLIRSHPDLERYLKTSWFNFGEISAVVSNVDYKMSASVKEECDDMLIQHQDQLKRRKDLRLKLLALLRTYETAEDFVAEHWQFKRYLPENWTLSDNHAAMTDGSLRSLLNLPEYAEKKGDNE